MTSAVQTAGAAAGPDSSSSLADVIETILDKGLVIDAHVGVGVVGIQILTIDARIVVASVDTYLRFAEAVDRLDLAQSEGQGLPEVVHGVGGGVVGKAGEHLAGKAGQGALGKAGTILGEIVGGGDDDRERERAPRRRRREED
jgi:gas vesicle structural protein